MKKMLRPITAAEMDEDTRLKDTIDILEDDFSYAIAGLEKLGRGSKTDYDAALVAANGLQSALNQVISKIAGDVQEV